MSNSKEFNTTLLPGEPLEAVYMKCYDTACKRSYFSSYWVIVGFLEELMEARKKIKELEDKLARSNTGENPATV